jgi:RNA polymerase-binding transcription factor DksA
VPIPLDDADRAALRDLLVTERARTQQRLSSLERSFDEMVAAADLEPPDDEHDPEGTTAYERAQVNSLAAEARAQLARLERALIDIEHPDYGACRHCGRPIGWARLQALPGTTRCVRCATSAQSETLGTSRPAR